MRRFDHPPISEMQSTGPCVCQTGLRPKNQIQVRPKLAQIHLYKNDAYSALWDTLLVDKCYTETGEAGVSMVQFIAS